MDPATPLTTDTVTSLFSLSIDRAAWALHLNLHYVVIAIVALLIVIIFLWRWAILGSSLKKFEIDQAELGIGNNKLRFRPNSTDRQVAYAIWVELSTRKLGLPIDLDHDVVSEVYDSWYQFFSVTRDLIKSVPVNQVRRSGTQAIIKLSIEVLNEGLRPHLTRWQARYRVWYERELKRFAKSTGEDVLDPQEIQATFPHFDELKKDLLQVNDKLVRYRRKMRELALEE